MSSPLYLLLYSDGFYSTVLQYITLPYQVYRVLQGANAPFAAKVVVFVKHTMITYIEVQCCTVDDTIYTVKYCKKNKQTDDNMWLYFSRMTRRPSGGGRQRLFTQQQELAVVDLVRADNAIRLHQLRQKILADRQVFNNITMWASPPSDASWENTASPWSSSTESHLRGTVTGSKDFELNMYG